MYYFCEMKILPAELSDVDELLRLQSLAYRSEAERYGDWSIPPLTETAIQLRLAFADTLVLKAVEQDVIVGSVRGQWRNEKVAVGRLFVAPSLQRRGVGSKLLVAIEAAFPLACCFELFTGAESEANLRLYQRHGYAVTERRRLSSQVTLAYLQKRRGQVVENTSLGGSKALRLG